MKRNNNEILKTFCEKAENVEKESGHNSQWPMEK